MHGNLIIDKDKGMAAGKPQGLHVWYNERNQPVQMGDDISYRYNAAGQRYYKKVAAAEEYYVMDGDMTMGVFTNSGSGWELQHWNIIGNGVEGRINESGNKNYYYKDHLGSTRAVVNASGTVLQATDYYPFGLIMDGRSYLSGSPAKEGFTGKERDDETGFDYFGARFYRPDAPGFISVDPLAGEYPGVSPYAYVLNNPLYYTDPTGECPMPDLFCLGMRDGATNSLTNTWDGLKQLFTSPGEVAGNLIDAVVNYEQTWGNIKSGAAAKWDMASSGNPYLMGRVAGEATMLVAEAAVGTKGLGSVASTTTKVLKSVDKVADAGKASTQGGLNLFKWGAPQTTKATGWKAGDYMLHLPNKGTPALNWKANYGALRSEMGLGKPIFDSYRNGAGQLIQSRVWDPIKGKYVGEFLNAERYILQSRGWIYNSGSGVWLPPGF